MKFLFPEILYALAAVAIPVIVHLFNFRKFKKVQFSNVEFLKEIKQETQSKSKLKHLLILLSRMLAITCLVLAFAQPYIPVDNQKVSNVDRVVSVFLDNSFSMEGEGEEGRLLEVARNKALQIVEFYSPTDRFQILTQDFEGRHQRLVNKDEAIELIGEVEISSQSKELSEILIRQKDAVSDSEGDKTAFIVSDFQKSITDLEICQNEVDSLIKVVLVPTQSLSPDNNFIDSLWFDTPVRQINQVERLQFTTGTTSQKTQENIPSKLSINGAQKAVGKCHALPNELADTSLYYTNTEAGWKSGILEIDDYPVTFDDQFFFTYNVAEEINVLQVKGKNAIRDYFENIFSGDPFFNFKTVSEGNIDYNAIGTNDLLILNQIADISSGLASELGKFADKGGTIFLIPSEDARVNSYNAWFSNFTSDRFSARLDKETKVSSINIQHFIYRDVFEKVPQNIDLPKVLKYFPLKRNSVSEAEVLLGMRTGDPYLIHYEQGKGRIFALTVPLQTESGNLAQHAIFVTSTLRIAEYSQPKLPLFYTIGNNEAIELRNVSIQGDEIFKVSMVDGSGEFIPQHRQVGGSTQLYLKGGVKSAGHYIVKSASEILAFLAYNYPRSESDLNTYSNEELKSQIQSLGMKFQVLDSSLDSIGKSVRELSEGKRLWITMIILALIFLAIEILLIKFWK